MKRPNITPLPWNCTKGVIPCVNAQIGRTPVNIAKTIYGSHDDALNNARAIAALPDLLAALEQIAVELADIDLPLPPYAKAVLIKAGYTFDQ